MNSMLLASNTMEGITKYHIQETRYIMLDGGSVWTSEESNFGGQVGKVKITFDVYLHLKDKQLTKSYFQINKIDRATKKTTIVQRIPLAGKTSIYLGRFEQIPKLYWEFVLYKYTGDINTIYAQIEMFVISSSPV